MELKGTRALLRPWRSEDAGSLVRYANNHKIARWLADRFPHPYGPTDAEQFIAYATSGGPEVIFAITTEGQAIGGTGLHPGTDVYRRSAELGYWLGEPFWGRGIVTEAVSLITSYGLGHLGMERIFARVFDGNGASARVLEKCGFEREGVLRRAAIKEGRMLDLALYAKVR